MKATIFSLVFISGVSLFYNCTHSTGDKAAEKAEILKDSVVLKPETKIDTSVHVVNALFIEFTLGDASHYIFKDDTGKDWDFGGCDDKNYDFAIELPEKEANSENQGYLSNKKLQGKWFELKYVFKTEPLYLEGPIGQVPVIIAAKQIK